MSARARAHTPRTKGAGRVRLKILSILIPSGGGSGAACGPPSRRGTVPVAIRGKGLRRPGAADAAPDDGPQLPACRSPPPRRASTTIRSSGATSDAPVFSAARRRTSWIFLKNYYRKKYIYICIHTHT